jgi:hypothetical protein
MFFSAARNVVGSFGGVAQRVLLLVGLSFAALPVGSALADPTIGQVGSDGTGCGPGVYADTNYAMFSGGGMITSFSFRSDSTYSDQQLRFLVLRPTATPNIFKVVGATGSVTLAGTGVETFSPASPIIAQAGDILGISTGENLFNCSASSVTGGGYIQAPAGDPSAGDVSFLAATDTQRNLNESANVVSASEMVRELLVGSIGVGPGNGRPGSTLAIKAMTIQAAVDANPPNTSTACAGITDYLRLVQSQAGKHLSVANAATLTTDADNLAAALGC